MSNHPFVPLRHRAVRMLWGAAVVSDAGTWVQLIVVGSLVAAGTGSAVQTGLVALATFMPQGIASPVGGLLADRFDRRKVFAAALLGQAVVTAGLAIALGMGIRSPGVLTLLILLSSAAGAIGAPSYAAMLPDLVPPEELMAMVSLGVYSWNSGRIIGPLIGTGLALVVGPAWTVGFNATSFVVMAGAVWLVRRPFRPSGVDSSDSVRARLLSGWRTLRATPACWHGVVLLVLFNLTVVPFMGLIPIYAKAEFGGGTGMAGMVASAQGVGAIFGGVLITLLAARYQRSYLVGRLIFVLAAALSVYALAPNRAWVIGAGALLGAGIVGPVHQLLGHHPARCAGCQPWSRDVDHAGEHGRVVRHRSAVHRVDRRCPQPARRLPHRRRTHRRRLRRHRLAVAELARGGRRQRGARLGSVAATRRAVGGVRRLTVCSNLPVAVS